MSLMKVPIVFLGKCIGVESRPQQLALCSEAMLRLQPEQWGWKNDNVVSPEHFSEDNSLQFATDDDEFIVCSCK